MSIQQNFPAISPSLSLNFARSKTLDPRITFTRTSTATRVNGQGLIEVVPANTPRFDHSYDPVSGTVKSLGLLIEELRTNIKIRSEELQFDFSRASITTISENEIISPDGLQTTDGIVPNVTLTAHYLDKVLTSTSGITASQNICCSAFFKKGVGRDVLLQIYEESGNAYHGVQFNFETETLTFRNSNEYTTGGGVTTDYGVIKYPNGWYRLWVAGYPNTTTTGRRYRIRLTDASGALDFSGDAVSSYLYAWGVQVEIGSFPTSYIPTSGSTATRTADNASMVGENFSDWFNPNEGTLYTSASILGKNIHTTGVEYPNGICKISNSGETASYSRVLYFGGHSDPDRVVFGNRDSSTSITIRDDTFGDIQSNQYYRVCGTYINNDEQALCLNGRSVGYNGTNVNPPTPNQFLIGVGYNGGIADAPNQDEMYLNGHISQLTYYPRRLTNTQLQNLTK